MMRKMALCFLALYVLPCHIFAISDTQQQLQLLKKVVAEQQRQLQQQGREIALLEKELPHSHKLLPKSDLLTSKSESLVSVRKVFPQRDSISRQATSSEDVVAIPKRYLILGNKKSYLSLSGQISEMGIYATDGSRGHFFVATNTVSNSRFSVDSKFKPNKHWQIGSHVQLGFAVNPSILISQTAPTSANIDMRRVEVYVKNDKMGSVFLGKGETASDNTSYSDLSGTKLGGRASAQDIGGGLFFRDANTGQLSSVDVNDTINGLDGFSRRNRLRYDTPKLYGFHVATSLIEGDRSDIALFYGGLWGATKISADIALTSPQSFNTGVLARGNELNSSASVLFPVGISMTGAGGAIMAKDQGRDDPYFFYVKPGYQFTYFNSGLTALSVDFGRYYNFAQNNDKADAYGVQFLQNFNSWDLAVYLAYRRFVLDRPGSKFDALNLEYFGAMYKF